MKKYLEIKSYEKHGIEVLVKIDYSNGLIALVEKEPSGNTEIKTSTKKWAFGNREIEYMAGWIQILDAMKHAIEQATMELQAFQDEEEKQREALMVKLAVEHE